MSYRNPADRLIAAYRLADLEAATMLATAPKTIKGWHDLPQKIQNCGAPP